MSKHSLLQPYECLALHTCRAIFGCGDIAIFAHDMKSMWNSGDTVCQIPQWTDACKFRLGYLFIALACVCTRIVSSVRMCVCVTIQPGLLEHPLWNADEWGLVASQEIALALAHRITIAWPHTGRAKWDCRGC
eukprot:102049-Amphidinium_carterae.1